MDKVECYDVFDFGLALKPETTFSSRRFIVENLRTTLGTTESSWFRGENNISVLPKCSASGMEQLLNIIKQ